ncbi:MAG: oxaloacetate-decarboxylating malate dehydrogenase, partial [Gammaproteobacteria bacterium]
TFNDDIQGTGAVTVAGLLAASKLTGRSFRDHRIVMLGAGSSAIGICDQIVAAMASQGVPAEVAKRSLWLVDSQGLVHDRRAVKEPFKEKYEQPFERLADWQVVDSSRIAFHEVISNVQPTILIGTSAQPGAFTEDIVREMAKHVERPIIFPLSNPTSKSEAAPIDIFKWTNEQALVATGSPFAPVVTKRGLVRIGQCNNSFVFPGVGLGIIASGARRVTDAMFVAAARVLSDFSPAVHDAEAPLYPPLEQVREISRSVALAVGIEAQRSGLAPVTTVEALEQVILGKMWRLDYRATVH